MANGDVSGSRVVRASKLGKVAASHTLRSWGTKTANLGRSEEQATAALGRQQLQTADQIVSALGTMKGASMKIGQALSVLDVGLVPEEFREEFQKKLSKLQDAAPKVRFRDMRKVIESDLGERLDDVFEEFDEDPIASASIGQVYRARLADDGREVAVKVQYPKVKEAVRADLQNLGLILKLLSRVAPGIDSADVADEIRERVTEELDYELEAQNQRAVARALRGHPFFVVPEVVGDLCRERVIVSEFVDGRSFSEVLDAGEDERERLAEILFRFYVCTPFRTGLLSGDPHPGNSLFLDDGRVAFLDFGFFKRLSSEAAGEQVEVLRAVLAEDAGRLMELTAGAGIVSADGGAAELLLEKYVDTTGWFLVDEDVGLTPDVATRVMLDYGGLRGSSLGEVRLPGEHVMTLRSLLLTLGVLGQLRVTRNWFAIAREWLLDAEPVTDLGKQESGFYAVRAA